MASRTHVKQLVLIRNSYACGKIIMNNNNIFLLTKKNECSGMGVPLSNVSGLCLQRKHRECSSEVGNEVQQVGKEKRNEVGEKGFDVLEKI